MRIGDLFEKWGLTGLNVKTPILEMEWELDDADKDAAWDLYVELLTRLTTQQLPDDCDETALASVYELFRITRSTLKQYGPEAVGISSIAVIVLNQVVRPFTAKWHRLSQGGAFDDPGQCQVFRGELGTLQAEIRKYTKLLADLLSVEDLTDMHDE